MQEQAPYAQERKLGRPTRSNEQLLDTALELFLTHGFERTSIDAIASNAGMAKRTIYARYPDKTEIFRASLQRAIEQWIVPIEHLRACETDDLEKTLLSIATLLLDNILNSTGLRLLRLSNSVAESLPEIAAYNTHMGTEPTLAYLADLFRRRVLPSNAPDPEADEAALAFLHLVVGGPANTAAWGVSFSPEALTRHTRYCVRLFLHGALPAQDSNMIFRENRQIKAAAVDIVPELEKLTALLKSLQAAETDAPPSH